MYEEPIIFHSDGTISAWHMGWRTHLHPLFLRQLMAEATQRWSKGKKGKA